MDIEGEYYYMVLYLCNEDYFVSTCVGFMSGEWFFTRNEESCTFGSHGRVKFELRSGFVYLEDNPTSALQYPCFDKKNLPKYKW